MSHHEIVQTDAEQPWHVRLVATNGVTMNHSENYTSRENALTAVAVAAEAFGITMNRPPTEGDPEVDGVGCFGEAPDGRVYLYDVRDVDEREPEG